MIFNVPKKQQKAFWRIVLWNQTNNRQKITFKLSTYLKKKSTRGDMLSRRREEKKKKHSSHLYLCLSFFFQPSLPHKHKSNPLYILAHSVNYSHSLNPKIEIQQKQTNVALIKKKNLALFICNYVLNFIIYDVTLLQLGWFCPEDESFTNGLCSLPIQ